MSSPTDQSDALGDYPELRKHVLKNVLHTRTIGAGTYGIVEEVVIPSSGTICAAKKIHAFNIQDRGLMVREFAKECQLMSSLLHPNVVQFFGIYYFPSDPLPSLVMERMLTSLHDLLDPKKRGTTEKSLFSLDLKFSILHDVASGLAYLHDQSPPIVHRNLSAKNVLLNSGMVAKVADLAEARRVSNTNIATLMTKCHGALYYLPPEARTERPEYDGTIDTFSFGVIAIFTISENFPCDVLEPNYTDEASGLLVPRTEVERRIKYLKNVEVKLGGRHPHLLELIRVCLHNHPPKRPNMKTVLDQLKKAGGGARPDEENVLIKALRRQVEELQSNIEAKDGQLSKSQQQLQDKECEWKENKAKLTKEIAELRKEELEWKENNAKLTKEIEDLRKNATEAKGEPEQQQEQLLKEQNEEMPRRSCQVEGSSPSLWELLERLASVEKKFYVIGLGLGVKENVLETIEESKEACLRKVLRECLKQVKLTWKDVIDVLSSDAVKASTLAEKLRKEFCSSAAAPDSSSSVKAPTKPGDMAELQQRYNLRSEDLDEPCSYQHRLDIGTFVSWKVVGPRLGRIEQKDMDDISLDMYNEQEKRQNLLQLWVERNGSNATYNAIITVMLEVKKRSETEKVCKLLTPKGSVSSSTGKLT